MARAWWLPVLLGSLLLAGCGGGSDLPPMVPVKGKVTVEGKPVTSGQVSFLPLAVDKDRKVPSSSGTIDASGNYEIFTGGKAGAPLGKYKVAITPSMVPVEGTKKPPKAPFNPRYQDPAKTKLEIEVVNNPSAGAYDLKLTP
ncbi:MAG: hypothetical protein L0Z62_12205 [Gemmataceae bacterium]|nr:hypothetical protein [Gemmataceae bacterium]